MNKVETYEHSRSSIINSIINFFKNISSLICEVVMARGKQKGRGVKSLWGRAKRYGKKYGKKYGKMALAQGKNFAVKKAKQLAPVLMSKGMKMLSQVGSGRRRRRQRGGFGGLGGMAAQIGLPIAMKLIDKI